MKTAVKLFFFLPLMFVLLVAASCKKKKEEKTPVPETSTMTDVEGNVYNTVKIGGKWWMAENLRVKRYRNGAAITQVTFIDQDSVWANKTRGAYCKYFNDDNNAKKFGLLYNFYAIVDTSNIAPAGWHVATDDEWKMLEAYVGMPASEYNKVNWRGTDEGNKLKQESPTGWTTFSTVWSTNESGFSALGGCCRLFDGRWGDPGVYSTGFWWTSDTHNSDNEAWFRYLDYKDSRVYRYHVPKTYGMSIRCVAD
jgi:uncharacterized protein (TIGR02145 family)